MPDIQPPGSFEGFRARLQAELDAQFTALAESHASEIDAARQAAQAEADARWTATLEGTRAEWRTQLEQDVAAARAEAERRAEAALAETRAALERARAEVEQAAAERARRLEQEIEQTAARVRSEVEQAAAERVRHLEQEIEQAAARARSEAEQAVAGRVTDLEREIERAADRARSEAEQAAYDRLMQLQNERDQAVASARTETEERLRAERVRAEQELADARAALEAERQRAASLLAAPAAAPSSGESSPDVTAARLLETISAIDAARSLSDILALTAAAAASTAPRGALFVANGPQLEEWTVPDVPQLSSGTIRTNSPDAGLLGEAMATSRVRIAGSDDATAPAFARLPPGRRACAAPLTLGGQPVAVVYADEGPDGDDDTTWTDTVEIIARHATACLAYLTAVRTAQAARLMAGDDQAPRPSRSSAADLEGARRYARLLVSEIKLYNEGAVRVGREKRDLQRRLKPEIERARRLFEERISAAVPGRDACFQQELVQTLADGDASLLG